MGHQQQAAMLSHCTQPDSKRLANLCRPMQLDKAGAAIALVSAGTAAGKIVV